MLKIRDDVDLKELEKFGFELDGNTYKYFIAKNIFTFIQGKIKIISLL